MNGDFPIPAFKIAKKHHEFANGQSQSSQTEFGRDKTGRKKPKNGKHSRKLGFHGFDKKNLTTNNLQTVIFATYGLIIFGIDPIYNLRNDF